MSHTDADEVTRFLNDYGDVMMAALQSYSEQMKAAAAATARIAPAAKGNTPALQSPTSTVEAFDAQAGGAQKYTQAARTAEAALSWLFEKYALILAPPPPDVPS